MDAAGPTPQIPAAALDSIARRLESVDDLRLPGQLTRHGVPSAEVRVQYIRNLLQHDPGVFLERHGFLLLAAERLHFDPLRADYEVDFYLRQLEDQVAVTAPPSAGQLSAAAKNRRLAALHRLEASGDYFSDEAMRTRQPYLHHLYVGQYRSDDERATSAATQDSAGGGGGGEAAGGPPGSQLARSIMRGQEELELRTRRESEREQYEMQEFDDEEEGEEAEEDAAAVIAAPAGTPAETGGADAARPSGRRRDHAGPVRDEGVAGAVAPERVQISEEEREDYSSTFLDQMKQRFLSGQDDEVDYAAIDRDAGLDDDLAAEATRDLEERYFDA